MYINVMKIYKKNKWYFLLENKSLKKQTPEFSKIIHFHTKKNMINKRN